MIVYNQEDFKINKKINGVFKSSQNVKRKQKENVKL